MSIASAFLKARIVLSLDIDIDALTILKRNIIKLELEHIIFPVCTDIRYFEISNIYLPENITTIMNPPFGVQRRTADRIFLEKAFSISNIVYSIHLASEKVHKFISKFAETHNWKIDQVIPFNLILEKSFPFHTQQKKMIEVQVYRFIKK